MDYKSILLYVRDPEEDLAAMNYAIALAKKQNAELRALYIVPAQDSLVALVSGGMGPEVVKQRCRELRARGELCEQKFTSIAQNSEMAWKWQTIESERERAIDELLEHSKYHDISVLTQFGEDEDVLMAAEIPEKMLLESGRPLIVVPSAYRAQSGVADSVLIGWNQSKEAARAVSDSVQILKFSKKNTAVWIADSARNEIDVTCVKPRLESFFARHGVTIDFEIIDEHVDDVGPTLVLKARQLAADLIVVGGYGESRLKEYLLGGATRHLLRKSEVPILISH